MTKMVFLVAVEGKTVYEGNSRAQANHVYEMWIDRGYYDVMVEEWEEDE